MVKVISAYNFQEQNIYSTSGEITATCLVGSNRLSIAHKNHLIEIITLRERISSKNGLLHDHNENQPPIKTAFPTVDQVEQIAYCKNGNFLVTLESKCDQTDEWGPRFVRVYTNFDVVQGDNCFTTPMRARIASMVTPKSCSPGCIEVIEIPIYARTPNLIACCQASGTIAICCGNILYFHEMRLRSNDTHKFSFIDFFEFPFNIKLEFNPQKLSIAEHIVACLNETTAVAFKIVDLSDTNTEDGSTSNSMATDSSINVVQNRTNEPIDFEVAKKCNQVNGIELRSEIRSNLDNTGDRRSSFSEEKPVAVNDIKIDLNYPDVVNVPSDRLYYSVRSLVQLRLPQNKGVRQIHDEFRCLALKPIYHRKDHVDGDERGTFYHIMKSTLNACCVGFSLFVTTVSDGYLYQFTNQGKWYTENMKCLATYPFTAPVVDVIIDNFVIHAVTESGIETFSSRIGHKLFSSYFEYPMMSDPYPSETSPLVDVPICVMGICGFFGVKHVVASHKKLVLLSTDKERNATLQNQKNSHEKFEPEWTIYDLQLPKPETLVLDILNLANLYNPSSLDVYYELLEEAHIIARLARELRIDKNDSEYITKDLEKIYVETCQLLADFTIQSDRKDIYSQAVAYYLMCKQPVWTVYEKYCDLQLPNPKSTQFIGLIYTLKLLLSRTASSKSDSDYLNSNVAPILPPTNVSKQSDHTIAEEFLNLFKTYAPSEIASIALISPVFREILHERLFDWFTQKEQLQSDEKICLILCMCRKNDMESALGILETLKRKDLFLTLKEHWLLIFDNYHPDNYRRASFSDLTENVLFICDKSPIIEAICDVFIHLLIVAQYIDLDFILKLFMNYFAVYLGHKGYRISQKMLEIILQAYFYDLYNIFRPSAKMSDLSTQNSDPMLTQSQSTLAHENSNENIKFLAPNWIYGGTPINRNNSRFSEDSPTTSTTVDSNYEDPEFEGLKVLFRMYLGLLKQHSGDSNSDMESGILSDFVGYRLAFIDYMARNVKTIKSVHSKLDRKLTTFQAEYISFIPNYDSCDFDEVDATSFRRPILFFERRESYLNKMPPFNGDSFKLDTDNVYYFDDWDKEVNIILIKLQALLNSGRLDSSFIDDFIAFIQSNPNVIGIDSLITILLPKPEGVEFLIHVNPEYLMPYAHSRLTTNNQWQVLFKRIVKKKRELLSTDGERSAPFYDNIIKDLLRSLLEEKPLEEFLSCIPEQEISLDYVDEKEHNQDQLPLTNGKPHSQDGINESNPFQVIIREAVAKQRSDALCAMIQSTGKQLFDAVNNYQLHLN